MSLIVINNYLKYIMVILYNTSKGMCEQYPSYC